MRFQMGFAAIAVIIALAFTSTPQAWAEDASSMSPLQKFLHDIAQQMSGGADWSLDQLIALASSKDSNYPASLALFANVYQGTLSRRVEESLRAGTTPDFDPTGIIVSRHFSLDVPVAVSSSGSVSVNPSVSKVVPFPFNILTFATPTPPSTPTSKITVTAEPTKFSLLAHRLFEELRADLIVETEKLDTTKSNLGVLYAPELLKLQILYKVLPYIDCRLMMMTTLAQNSYYEAMIAGHKNGTWPTSNGGASTGMPYNTARDNAGRVVLEWAKEFGSWVRGDPVTLTWSDSLHITPMNYMVPACSDAEANVQIDGRKRLCVDVSKMDACVDWPLATALPQYQPYLPPR